MIEQQGRVLSLGTKRATILLGASPGCPSCDAGKGCGAGIFGRLVRRKAITMELDKELLLTPALTPTLTAGQAVIVGIPEAFFLRLLARFYLLPLLAGLLGATLGHALALIWKFGAAGQDFSALLGALIFAVLPLLRNKSMQYGFAAEKMVRILGYPASQAGQQCAVNVDMIENPNNL